MKAQKISAGRAKSIDEIPVVKSANSTSLAARIEVVLSRLNNLKAAKPRRVKTLTSTVTSLFPEPLTERDVTELLKELERRGTIAIHEGKVSYGNVPAM